MPRAANARANRPALPATRPAAAGTPAVASENLPAVDRRKNRGRNTPPATATMQSARNQAARRHSLARRASHAVPPQPSPTPATASATATGSARTAHRRHGIATDGVRATGTQVRHRDDANSTAATARSEEHTSELQSLMRSSYAV